MPLVQVLVDACDLIGSRSEAPQLRELPTQALAAMRDTTKQLGACLSSDSKERLLWS
jgi:hypothetical protein